MITLPMIDPIVPKALTFAVNAHDGQEDREGHLHIFHSVRVASKLREPIAIASALLHDVVEDTQVTNEEIRMEFGNDVADVVAALTRGKNETWNSYIGRVMQNEVAMMVKLHDIQDNISRDPKPHKIGMYLEAAQAISAKLGGKAKIHLACHAS